jgi:hypothetical protein
MKRTITSLIALLPISFAACGGSGSSDDCKPTGGANTAQYVVNVVNAPGQREDTSIDLDGSGRKENALGQVLGAISGTGLRVQDGITSAVNSGALIILATENSTDPAFQSDSCAGVQIQLGSLPSGVMMPDFSGNGSFTASGKKSDVFAGPINAGKFNSAPPATTTSPVSVEIALPLVAGAPAVDLKIIGGHITFTNSGGMIKGELHGAIKESDVQGSIIPNVAALLTTRVMAYKDPNDPNKDVDKQIAGLFDKGGKPDPKCPAVPPATTGTCWNAATNKCAAAGDFIVDACEVATSNLIQNVLSPDVAMFDSAGNYKPDPNNPNKDSLSLGLGFTMVKAKF